MTPHRSISTQHFSEKDEIENKDLEEVFKIFNEPLLQNRKL